MSAFRKHGRARRSIWQVRRTHSPRAGSTANALGGGMRQVGVLAAAGLIAMEDSPENSTTTTATPGFSPRAWRAFRGFR